MSSLASVTLARDTWLIRPQCKHVRRLVPVSSRALVVAKSSNEAKEAPSSGQQEDDVPIWVRNERTRAAAAASKSLPWPLSLLLSSFVAIAAVGSIFEYTNQHAVFGVLMPDNPLWAPLLLFMAVTGWPTAGFLFLQGVQGFNEAAELQDKMDGYID